MTANKSAIEGIPVTIDTETESTTKMMLFVDMPDESLVNFIMDYPVAMNEWIRRLRAAETE